MSTDLDPALPVRGAAALLAATEQLRAQPVSVRMVEIADSVLSAVLRAPRRQVTVHARAPYAHLRVSSLVVSATLRDHLEAALPGVAVRHVAVEVDDEQHLVALRLELVVRYRSRILDVGDRARTLAAEALVGIFGAGPDAAVAVEAHVHVGDVTRGDPQLVDPADE